MPRNRLHIGCGPQLLPGWTNLDNQHYPGVDRVIDVTLGLPFTDVEYVFAEHFIEHLSFDDALNFMRECRRVLTPDGILRLSTPNLDWVMATHYRPETWSSERDAIASCFVTNRAFRGWGHQFLYNRQSLEAVLRMAGFTSFEVCRYGESKHDALRGIERHERYGDFESLSDLIVIEASGEGGSGDSVLPEIIEEFRLAIDVV